MRVLAGMGFPHTIRLTGSLGAISGISGRALSVARDDRDRERPHNVPGFYTTHTALSVYPLLLHSSPQKTHLTIYQIS